MHQKFINLKLKIVIVILVILVIVFLSNVFYGRRESCLYGNRINIIMSSLKTLALFLENGTWGSVRGVLHRPGLFVLHDTK